MGLFLKVYPHVAKNHTNYLCVQFVATNLEVSNLRVIGLFTVLFLMNFLKVFLKIRLTRTHLVEWNCHLVRDRSVFDSEWKFWWCLWNCFQLLKKNLDLFRNLNLYCSRVDHQQWQLKHSSQTISKLINFLQ